MEEGGESGGGRERCGGRGKGEEEKEEEEQEEEEGKESTLERTICEEW